MPFLLPALGGGDGMPLLSGGGDGSMFGCGDGLSSLEEKPSESDDDSEGGLAFRVR